MDETISSPPRRGPRGGLADLGRVRMATLAGGSAALALVGWCGAYVSRSLGPEPAAPAAPAIVLAPVGPPVATPTPVAAPALGAGAAVASSRSAVVAAHPTAVARQTSAGPGPGGLSALSIEVPVPVRSARLAVEHPSSPEGTAAAAGVAAQSHLALAGPANGEAAPARTLSDAGPEGSGPRPAHRQRTGTGWTSGWPRWRRRSRLSCAAQPSPPGPACSWIGCARH